MADRTEARVAVSATPGQVMAVICAVEDYPQWNPEMRSVRVLTRDAAGRPAEASFVVDAGLVKGEYVLRYSWNAEAKPRVGSGSVTWQLVEGAGLDSLDGGYTVTGDPDGSTTEVAYWLTVEPAFPVLAPLKRKAEQRLVERAVHELKTRVEAAPHTHQQPHEQPHQQPHEQPHQQPHQQHGNQQQGADT